MFTATWIILVSIFALSFFAIVITTLLFAKPVDEYKFSFMRIFPFEVMVTAENNAKFYAFSAYLFSGMCFSPLILIGQGMEKASNLNPLSIIICCTLGLAGLCFVFVNVFDVTHVKAHIALFTVYGFLTLLTGVLVVARGLVAYTLFNKHGHNELIFLITAILAGVVSIFISLLLVNPKLKTWPRLDQVDGKYVRPKRFVLAYSEWGLLLAQFLLGIIYFVQLLVK